MTNLGTVGAEPLDSATLMFVFKSKCNVYAICRQTQLSTRWYQVSVSNFYQHTCQTLQGVRNFIMCVRVVWNQAGLSSWVVF